MDPHTLLIVLSFAMAAFLKGLTGIGFASICLGIIASFVDMKTAIALVILPSLASNFMVIIGSGRMKDAFVKYWPLYACALSGLVAGLWLLGRVQSETSRTVLGVMIVAYSLWALVNQEYVLSDRMAKRLLVPVGVATGVANGLTGSQIIPVLPYLMSLGIDKNLLVATINTSFTLSSLIMLGGMWRMGFMNSHTLVVALVGTPLVALGIFLGTRLRNRSSEKVFRILVLVLLLGIGVNLAL